MSKIKKVSLKPGFENGYFQAFEYCSWKWVPDNRSWVTETMSGEVSFGERLTQTYHFGDKKTRFLGRWPSPTPLSTQRIATPPTKIVKYATEAMIRDFVWIILIADSLNIATVSRFVIFLLLAVTSPVLVLLMTPWSTSSNINNKKLSCRRDRVTLRIIEYFAKSLKVIRNDTVEYSESPY